MNVEQNDNIEWTAALETYFLLAEAKLRLNLGDKTVQEYYEAVWEFLFSFQRGATGQILTSRMIPMYGHVFVDPTTERSTDGSSMVSNLTVVER